MRGGRYSLGSLCPCLAWHGAWPLMWAQLSRSKGTSGRQGPAWGSELSIHHFVKSWSKGQPSLPQMQKPKPGFLPKAAKWENRDGSPIQSLSHESLVVGKKGSVGRGDGQEARSRDAADFRGSREAHIYCPARVMRWRAAQWLLDIGSQ